MILALLLSATPLEAQRAFEGCLEREADRAARAGVEPAALEEGLPGLCVAEQEALVTAVAARRAGRDPALTNATDGAERGAEAAVAYADGLRRVVLAGYPTLLQLRGPAPDPNRYPYGGPVIPNGAAGRASPPGPVPPPLALPSPRRPATPPTTWTRRRPPRP